MRWLLPLAILFAVLSVIFGVWVFAFAAHVAWEGVKVLFWVFVVLFLLSLLGWGVGGTRSPAP